LRRKKQDICIVPKTGNNQNRDSNNSEAVENNKNVENDKSDVDNGNDAPLRRSKGIVAGRQLASTGEHAARPVSLVERLSQVSIDLVFARKMIS
jgi:hypothetical protein